eukprot:TRINITY_DN5308_c0_g1_i1.p1 TRINITY_DN5308_c0_g1~~TRINITY_DN5308_c0_g1_i1.p1  ORF type:complete len:258 (+),score=55.14 TRINITY_DN5308_c0_g1_i1:271-1044(+)
MSYAGYSGYSPHGYASQAQHSQVRDRTAHDRSHHDQTHDRSSIMGNLDFQPIYEMDPSLADGHRAIYDREVQFELRTQESADKPHDVGTTEGVKVKVLSMGEETSALSLRIELSSECDLFFHYACNINAAGYVALQEEQKLMCEFKDFAPTLMRMLNKCIKEPHSYMAVLILQRDGNAVLEFIQNMEYKFVELLALPFKESPEHTIRQHISYRYNALKSRLAIMQGRLQDVNALVKVKNPSLLLQLQRSAAESSSHY